MEIIAIIISIYVLVKIRSLEKKLSLPQNISTQDNPEEKRGQEVIFKPEQQTKEVKSQQLTSDTPDPISQLVKWYAHEWPLKTGALLIVLGFVWLISYAFLNNWIGPMGRVSLGIIIGSIILIGAELRIRVETTQGTTLAWLGAAILLVTVYGAQMIYVMFEPILALGFIFIVMSTVMFISLRHKRYSLAIATLIIAGVAPSIVGAGPGDTLSLYSYLTIIVVGTVWVIWFSGWRSLIILSLLIVIFYSLPYLFHPYHYNALQLTPLQLLEIRSFSVILVTIFYIATLLPHIRGIRTERLDVAAPFAIALFSLSFIYSTVPEHLKSIITLLVAMVFALGAYQVFVKTSNKAVVYVYTGAATLLLAVATSFEFEGPDLVFALSVQALALPPIATKVIGPDKGKWLLLYFVLPILVSIPSITRSWNMGIFNNDFYALLAIAASLASSGLYYYYNKTYQQIKNLHDSATTLIILASLYGLLLIWRICHAVLMDENARMASLVIYTVVGLSLYVIGEIKKRRVLYSFGLIILIAVIARLLLFEIWNMELVGRIITFFVIGTLLIGSVLLRRSQKK